MKTIEHLNNVIIESMLGEEVLTEIGQYWARQRVTDETCHYNEMPDCFGMQLITGIRQRRSPVAWRRTGYFPFMAKEEAGMVYESNERNFLEPSKGKQGFQRKIMIVESA